jgi:hypothetical protein
MVKLSKNEAQTEHSGARQSIALDIVVTSVKNFSIFMFHRKIRRGQFPRQRKIRLWHGNLMRIILME